MNLELCRHCGRVIYFAADAPGELRDWVHEHSNLYSCKLRGNLGAPYAEPEA